MIKNIVFYLIFISAVLLPIEVDFINVYYDKNNLTHDLYRPKINITNSYISGEIHTESIEQKYTNYDNTVIFKPNFNNDTKSDNIPYYVSELTSEDEVDIKTPIKTNRIEWNTESHKIFFSINITELPDSLNEKDKRNLKLNIIDEKSFNSDNNTVIIKQLNAEKAAKKLTYGEPGFIKKYTISSPHTEESKSKYIPIIHMIHDTRRSNYRQISTNHSKNYGEPIDLGLNPTNIEVSLKNNIGNYQNSYNMLLEEGNDTNQNCIHLSCSIGSDNYFIGLYHTDKDRKTNQKEPLFNYDGTIVSYLNQEENTNRHFALYTVDVSELSDCGRFHNTYIKDPTSLKYKKIDSYILNQDYISLQPNARIKHTSYCWHPTKNILFYIKRDLEKSSNNFYTYSIYYYDIEKNIGPKKLNIPLDGIKYITISNDGEYLLFSFKTIKKEHKDTFTFNNDNNFTTNRNHKIGVAKLIYD